MTAITTVKNLNGATIISAETEIHASKEAIWEILEKPEQIQQFHPLIKSAQLKDDKSIRYCDLKPMGQMVEQIYDWSPGIGFKTKVISGKKLPPYEFMIGEVKIFESKGKNKVSFTFQYKLKYGFLGKLMNALLIKPQFKKAPAKYVLGLKEFINLKQ